MIIGFSGITECYYAIHAERGAQVDNVVFIAGVRRPMIKDSAIDRLAERRTRHLRNASSPKRRPRCAEPITVAGCQGRTGRRGHRGGAVTTKENDPCNPPERS